MPSDDKTLVEESEHTSSEMLFGGGVEHVIASPRIAPPPKTLEEARNAPGRAEKIEEITRRIEREGIKYVFFQQVSITGRVMGKGVVASFFPQVAKKGYQLVYGATANLFTDRHGELHRLRPRGVGARRDGRPRHLRRPAVGQPRRACVLRPVTTPRTGELMDADPRQNLKVIADEFEKELGLQFLIGIEPEMMWLKKPEGNDDARGRRRSPTATTSTSSRSSVRCCSTSSSTGRRSAST